MGALAIVAAYAMPWLGVRVGNQGVVLSGMFLGGFLAGARDLRQFMPGASGDPNEAAMLRALVLFFPASGAVAALFALATAGRTGAALTSVLLCLLGALPLAALVVGLGQLPPGTSPELGLWTIGGGAAAVILGGAIDAGLARVRR